MTGQNGRWPPVRVMGSGALRYSGSARLLATRPKNPMTGHVEVAGLDEIATASGVAVDIADRKIAFFNVDGKIHAVDDACIRCGTSLAAGTLRDATVTCSACAWVYDVTTGALVTLPSLRVDTYDIAIVDSKVVIALTWIPDS